MPLKRKHSSDGVNWKELVALYRAAPLGEKPPAHLKKVFANSMFQCFVRVIKALAWANRLSATW